MFEIQCPACEKKRTVKAKKSWMKGDPPYEKICKSCTQIGKIKSESHRRKLSESVKAAQTEEVIERKRQYMNEHPELWVNLCPELGNQVWTGRHHSEESKKLISDALTGREVPESVRQKISKSMKGNNNESQ